MIHAPFHSLRDQLLAKKPSSSSSMGNEDAGEKARTRETSSKNHGTVIITVYVESSSIRNPNPNPKSKSTNRQKHFSSKPPISARDGYDRKAQLLAYAQQLRSSNSEENQEIGWLQTKLRPKKKKCSWGAKIRLCFRRIFHRRQEYELPVVSDKEKSSRKKSDAARRNYSKQILRRLRSMLKGLSCGWNCYKG
ncbi:hypothetical protein NE237_022683 [Protea cynaroides]|uniref:Uncharacterized protein n=1 Tax=Protea cynaroides TaxID=273540 RepID=A0A9Q0HBG8_9MAGN|nr:hypothetical protein NE237_022683 [Protea cynaroides]